MKRRLENTDERKGDNEDKEATNNEDAENNNNKEQQPPANKRRKTKHERKTVVPPENTIVWKSYKKSMPKIPREVTEKLTGGIVSKNPETFVWSLANPSSQDNTNEQRADTGPQSTSISQHKADNDEEEEKQSSSKEKMSIKKLLDE